MIDITHIARLARIRLTEAEKEKFRKELSGILEFVEKLNEADTERVRPVNGGATLENAFREDAAEHNGEHERAARLIDAAPEKHRGWIQVKAIFNSFKK